MTAQIHPFAGHDEVDFIDQFAIKSIPRTKPAPREWIDGFAIPRGKLTIVALDMGQGKTTAVLNSMVSSSYTGVWTLFGTKDHGRPLRCVMVTGEESEEDFLQKLSYDGDDQAYEMASAAVAAGNLIIIPLDRVMERNASGERIFGEDGSLTKTGQACFNAIYRRKPDVVVFDTMRSCSTADYNQEMTSSQTISSLNLLARRANAATIMFAHVTKESGKLKLDDKSHPSTLISALRGSGQIVAQARHVVVMMRAPDELFKAIQLENEGDVKYAAAVKSNLGFPITGEIFPVIRSKKGLTFSAHVNGRSLLDIGKTNEKFTFLKLREVLSKLVFAAGLSGSPFTMTGQFSPEKLCDSTLHKLLPVGSTPELVSSAMKSLLAEHYVVQVKLTENGAPSRYDVFSGPYATASSEGVKVPATKGAPDTDLLRFAASEKAEVLGDILEYARNRGTLAEGVEDLCRLEPGDMRMPEITVSDTPPSPDHEPENDEFREPEGDDWEVPSRENDEVPGMSDMPSDDSWEQRDYADVEIPDMGVTLSFEDTSTPTLHTADIEQMTVTGKVDFDI